MICLPPRGTPPPARGGRDRRYRRGIGRRPGLKSADLEGLPTRPPVDCDIVANRQLLLPDCIDFALHSQISFGQPTAVRSRRPQTSQVRSSRREGRSGYGPLGAGHPRSVVGEECGEGGDGLHPVRDTTHRDAAPDGGDYFGHVRGMAARVTIASASMKRRVFGAQLARQESGESTMPAPVRRW